jgi:chromosomal replication initiation ATPase DnaA
MTPLEDACAPNRRESERRALEDSAFAAFITQLVALATGVGAREIAAQTRCVAEVARARQVAMYLAHTVCAWPLARVGAAFGRDRSTAAYACQRVEDMREDAAFDKMVGQCETCVLNAPRRLGMA